MKINHFFRAFRVLRLRGAGYLVYLFAGYLLLSLFYRIFRLYSPNRFWRMLQLSFVVLLGVFWVLLATVWGWQFASGGMLGVLGICGAAYFTARQLDFGFQMKQARELLKKAPRLPFTRWDSLAVTPAVRGAVEHYLQENPGEEVILGRVDNDGRLLGLFGPLPGWVAVNQTEFVPRYRFQLDVVLVDGNILIRKDFRGNRKGFTREWYNLARLMGKANIPAVYHVDEKRTILYKNMIPARTVRDILVDAGARILSVQANADPDLDGLSESQRLAAVLSRGTKLLRSRFSDDLFIQMEQQLDAIHHEGFARLSLTFGNIMVDAQGTPWFIDFEGCRHYNAVTNPVFLWWRDQDRCKFNQIYDRDILTENKAREKLAKEAKAGLGRYAPIDFGQGLTVGGFWTVDNGTGRWEYLNGRVLSPHIRGKRILDLGSNNGILSLMMLREGAREVIGLELDAEMVECASLVHRIFEWRDIRPYNFQIAQQDMRAILNHDWGKFDVITAFCSLYYLQEEEMAQIVRRAAQLAPVMVLQAKIDTRPEAGDNKAEKSSLPFLKKLLEANGFPYVDVFSPEGFSRPLLIGRRSK